MEHKLLTSLAAPVVKRPRVPVPPRLTPTPGQMAARKKISLLASVAAMNQPMAEVGGSSLGVPVPVSSGPGRHGGGDPDVDETQSSGSGRSPGGDHDGGFDSQYQDGGPGLGGMQSPLPVPVQGGSGGGGPVGHSSAFGGLGAGQAGAMLGARDAGLQPKPSVQPGALMQQQQLLHQPLQQPQQPFFLAPGQTPGQALLQQQLELQQPQQQQLPMPLPQQLQPLRPQQQPMQQVQQQSQSQMQQMSLPVEFPQQPQQQQQLLQQHQATQSPSLPRLAAPQQHPTPHPPTISQEQLLRALPPGCRLLSLLSCKAPATHVLGAVFGTPAGGAGAGLWLDGSLSVVRRFPTQEGAYDHCEVIVEVVEALVRAGWSQQGQQPLESQQQQQQQVVARPQVMHQPQQLQQPHQQLLPGQQQQQMMHPQVQVLQQIPQQMVLQPRMSNEHFATMLPVIDISQMDSLDMQHKALATLLSLNSTKGLSLQMPDSFTLEQQNALNGILTHKSHGGVPGYVHEQGEQQHAGKAAPQQLQPVMQHMQQPTQPAMQPGMQQQLQLQQPGMQMQGGAEGMHGTQAPPLPQFLVFDPRTAGGPGASAAGGTGQVLLQPRHGTVFEQVQLYAAPDNAYSIPRIVTPPPPPMTATAGHMMRVEVQGGGPSVEGGEGGLGGELGTRPSGPAVSTRSSNKAAGLDSCSLSFPFNEGSLRMEQGSFQFLQGAGLSQDSPAGHMLALQQQMGMVHGGGSSTALASQGLPSLNSFQLNGMLLPHSSIPVLNMQGQVLMSGDGPTANLAPPSSSAPGAGAGAGLNQAQQAPNASSPALMIQASGFAASGPALLGGAGGGGSGLQTSGLPSSLVAGPGGQGGEAGESTSQMAAGGGGVSRSKAVLELLKVGEAYLECDMGCADVVMWDVGRCLHGAHFCMHG